MLQSEFEQRVKMQISCKEYQSINEVYNNSTLDKDEFCKAWVRMNKERVVKAITEAKEKARVAALKDKAWDIIACYRNGDYHKMERPAFKVFRKRHYEFCESIGIKLRYSEHYPETSTSVRSAIYQLRKFVLN